MRQYIETYKGVNIIYSCGYYYPDINGNVECALIGDVRHWIDLWALIPAEVKQVFGILQLI